GKLGDGGAVDGRHHGEGLTRGCAGQFAVDDGLNGRRRDEVEAGNLLLLGVEHVGLRIFPLYRWNSLKLVPLCRSSGRRKCSHGFFVAFHRSGNRGLRHSASEVTSSIPEAPRKLSELRMSSANMLAMCRPPAAPSGAAGDRK